MTRPLVISNAKQSRSKFVALDGLRGFAAIFVVALHISNMLSGWWPSSAFLAVDLFFMLSGFVVPYAYERKLQQDLTFARFFEIRVIRLYPLYILGVSISLVPYLVSASLVRGLWPLHKPAVWTAWALFMLPVPAWEPQNSFPLNPPAWSLFLEMVVNVAYGLAFPWLRIRVVAAVAAVAMLALIVSDQHFQTGNFGTGGIELVWALSRVTCPFAIGVLLFRIWSTGRLSPARVPVMLPCLLFAGLLLLPGEGALGAALGPLLVVAGLTAVVMLGLRSRPEGGVARAFESLGLLSYPLYALHLPILNLCRGLLPMLGVGLGAATLIAVPVVFTVAWLSIRLYDEPVRARLTRWMALRRAQVDAAPAL